MKKMREDVAIKKTKRALSLMDKYQIDDVVRDVYIKISFAYAVKYRMTSLLEFLFSILSEDERCKN